MKPTLSGDRGNRIELVGNFLEEKVQKLIVQRSRVENKAPAPGTLNAIELISGFL